LKSALLAYCCQDTLAILRNDGCRNLKLLFQWVECNLDSDSRIVLGENLNAQNRSHECRDTLLPVDKDSLAGGSGAVLELHVRVAPCN